MREQTLPQSQAEWLAPAPIIDVLEDAEALALQVARFVAARISNCACPL
jgi:hypothetical protein